MGLVPRSSQHVSCLPSLVADSLPMFVVIIVITVNWPPIGLGLYLALRGNSQYRPSTCCYVCDEQDLLLALTVCTLIDCVYLLKL